jgi:ASPIC and UnbV
VQSGSGYCRCSPLEAHFGLGKAPLAGYRVEVLFPASKKRVVRDNVNPGQRLIVKEDEAKD